MIARLGPADPFPPADRALAEPNGLLAVGATLSVPRLLDAYTRGIFPWFSEGDPILWWCPDPRMVLPTAGVHVSRSLARRLRRADYHATLDRAFGEVLRGCAGPRRDDTGTWLLPSMIRAYERLHEAGVAHSIEIWMDGALVGGLYGVALGRMFYGESMFSRRTDASKMALVILVRQLARWGFPLLDCQMHTAHLASLGAIDMPRRDFLAAIAPLVAEPSIPGLWRLDDDLSAARR